MASGTRDATTGCLELVGGLGLATASGALAGSQFGTVGTIVGGLVGGLTATISAVTGLNSAFADKNVNAYTEEVAELKKSVEDTIQSFKDSKKAIEDTYESKLNDCKYSQQLALELEGLVDSNGKVLAGNEKRVDFILGELNNALGTEISRNGDLINNHGEVIGSYEQLSSTIDDIIAKKQEEARQEAITELYKESLKEHIALETKRDQLLDQASKLQKEYNKATEGMGEVEKFWWRQTEGARNLSKSMKETTEGLREVGEEINNNNEQVKNYEGQMQSIFETTADGITESNQQIAESSQQTTEQVKVSLDQLSADMITNGQVTQEQFATMITEGGDKLQEMVQNNVDKWNELYAVADEAQKASMLAQSTTLDTWSPQLQEKWANMAKNSSTDFANGIASVKDDVKAEILSSISNTENLTPEMINAWSDMATNSNTEFNKGIESLDEDVRGEVLAGIGAVNGLNETSRQAYANLGEKGKKAFNDKLASLDEDEKAKVLAGIIAVEGMTEENKRIFDSLSDGGKQAFNNAMNSLDTDARDKVQSAINAIRDKGGEMNSASYSTGAEAQKGGSAGAESNGGASQIGNFFVQGLLNALTGGQWSVWQAGFNLVKQAIFGGNEAQRTGSPAKETIKMGNYFTEGYIVGLKKKQEEVRKATSGLVGIALDEFKEINQGIKINTRDFAIDTNQYVNYSAIKGQIQAQSQVSINENIAKQIAKEVRYAMKNAEVNVNVEARTDEGVIFKKVQNSAREYTMQTGEPAFS